MKRAREILKIRIEGILRCDYTLKGLCSICRLDNELYDVKKYMYTFFCYKNYMCVRADSYGFHDLTERSNTSEVPIEIDLLEDVATVLNKFIDLKAHFYKVQRLPRVYNRWWV